MTENKYQAKLIKKLEKMFPGCIIMKTDTAYRQGLPDLLILVERIIGLRWKSRLLERQSHNPIKVITLSNWMTCHLLLIFTPKMKRRF